MDGAARRTLAARLRQYPEADGAATGGARRARAQRSSTAQAGSVASESSTP